MIHGTLALLFWLTHLLLAIEPEGPKGVAVKDVVEGNNRFALELYDRVRQHPGNTFFSPYSISTALAMTYAGAAGDTAKQMAATLHFPAFSDRLHPAFESLSKRINGDGKPRSYELVAANALWGQEGHAFRPQFLELLKTNYQAGLRPVDFRSTEHARETINEWVETVTRQKIKNLLAPGVLTPRTRLVLTNAIYFKGAWLKPFSKPLTKDDDFKLSADQTVRVPMMNLTTDFRYYDGGKFAALELPYRGNELSMIVVLPKSADGLAALEKGLSFDWMPKLASKRVAVAFPRFKIEKTFALEQVLAAMGMPDAFDQKRADFSGMTEARDLYLSAVAHKAFVDVNEEGTEAAAATAAVMGVRAAMPIPNPPIPFRANHPFVFAIRENQTGSILFLGRVSDPRS